VRAIFRRPEHQALFEQQGYILYDFLSPAQVQDLRDLYFSTAGAERQPYDWAKRLTYYISSLDQNPDRRKAATNGIRDALRGQVADLMIDYKAILCNFMIKDPGGGEIQVHQDTTLVDESRYVACNLFVPLQDTNVENGCFHLIPGTHELLEGSFRHNSIPDTLVAYNEALKPFMVPLPLPAGRGILFDHKMFHWSPDNRSGVPRVAVQLLLVPSEAGVVIAHYDAAKDPDHVRLLSVPEEYLTERNLFQAKLAEANELPLVDVRPYRKLPAVGELVEMIRSRNATS
jgi:ectoine hydroxylase-related dioxygenase (phytanoyl-CoA dioxygenase family)